MFDKEQLTDLRATRVQALADSFVARGVSPSTALEWAEAETPSLTISFKDCTFWETNEATEKFNPLKWV